MDLSNLYDLFLSCEGLCTDTRQLKEGEIFLALQGDHFNGNHYAKEALSKGAAAAIVDDKNITGERIFHVENGLKALHELARIHRGKLDIPVIGLTGSNGKTTTKELIVAVLEQKYKVGYTHGNLNNHIGVPLSILGILDEDEIAVIEMGANHQKEIELLSGLCQPDHGLITNFGKAHLEGFGGVEGIIKGKSELYDNLSAGDRTAWVNISDSIQMEKSAGLKRYTFGDNSTADYPVYYQGVNEQGCVQLSLPSQLTMKSNLSGAYNFSNLASAVALGQYFNVPNESIKKAIEGYWPVNNRSQLENTASNILLKDYYNANPTSMLAALENFKSFKAEAKWVILGDMFELGVESKKEHQAIGDYCLKQEFEKVILVGSHFAATTHSHAHFKTTEDLVNFLKTNKPKGKTILIKGSRGMQLEKVVAYL